MSIEHGEQVAQSISMDFSRTSVRMVSRVSMLSLKKILLVMRLGALGAGKAVKNHITNGELTIKKLQQISGGDLHQQVIKHEVLENIQTALKKRGVSFAVEHGVDDKAYLHFSGKDVDSFQHALSQVYQQYEHDLGNDLTPAKEVIDKPNELPDQSMTPVKKPTRSPRNKNDVLKGVKKKAQAKRRVARTAHKGSKKLGARS